MRLFWFTIYNQEYNRKEHVCVRALDHLQTALQYTGTKFNFAAFFHALLLQPADAWKEHNCIPDEHYVQTLLAVS